MAPRRPLSPRIRRRRIVAGVAFAVVLVAIVVSIVALQPRRPSPPSAAAKPPVKPFRIVFPEGFTRAQMATRVRDVARIAEAERHHTVALARASYLRASRSRVVPCFGSRRFSDLEGFLFPATYDFFARTSSHTLVSDQLRAFCQRWHGVNLAYARSKHLTAHDVLVIASMIEKEAAVPSERRLVAAVIYNRLRNRMPLGIDATLRYGLQIPPSAAITESELQSNNPYNTRKFLGFPPTPISNPGLSAIEAAAHPAAVDYLYYARVPGSDRQFFTASASAFDTFLSTHGYK